MTREEILRMAREAGVRVARMLAAMENNEAALTETEARDIAAIERFAHLVAAAEREACAQVCDARGVQFFSQSAFAVECHELAHAIERAHGVPT